MVPTPDASLQDLINIFVTGCKDDLSLNGTTSNWEECDIIRMRCVQSAQAANLNWKDPATFASAFASSPLFVPYGYVDSDGGGYIDENWNAASDGVKYTLNSASMDIYIISEINVAPLCGVFEAGLKAYIYPRDAGLLVASINSLVDTSALNPSRIGYYTVYRQDANDQHITIDDAHVASNVANSVSLPVTDFVECGLRNVTPVGIDGNNAASHRGSGYVDYAKMYNRFNAFLTGVGAI